MTFRPDPITGAMGPWNGGEVSPLAACLLAPNSGPMTLDGTNTWVLSSPGSSSCLVVDPGPDMAEHLQRVVEHVRSRDLHVDGILLTHGHPDHAEGAARFARDIGSNVRALDPAHCLGSEGLSNGDVVACGDLELRVVGTPGHTSDSLSFFVANDQTLLTGDTVLGRGTTVVMHPDGKVGDYLRSLATLRVYAESGISAIYPGHGPVLTNATQVLHAYEQHRRDRLDAVAALLPEVADADDVVMAVVERVYANVPKEVWPAAALSVAAQIEYLRS